MRMPRFYENQQLQGLDQVVLSEAVFQHAAKVLRLGLGDELFLFNGDGFEYHAKVSQVDKRHMQVKLLSSVANPRESSLQLEIGQAISRGERMDYAIQKSTELGCQKISPLFTERCEVRLSSERQDKRQRHWQQTAISACEQSLRSIPPDIAAPQPLEAWLKHCTADLKLVLHPHQEAPLDTYTTPQSVAVLIGPEGGLTEAEIELALSYGFKRLRLGPRVLRTETAPVAVCTLLNYLWGDLH